MTLPSTTGVDILSSYSPIVYVVVLNWNSWCDTLTCLASLAHLDYPNYRVVVVDNGSEDGSEGHIREAYPNINLIQTECNLGYAGGNNVGIRYALRRGAEYVLLVNPDIVVERGTLRTLLTTAVAHGRIGALSPIIRYKEDPTRVWFAGGTIDWRMGKTAHIERTNQTDNVFSPSAWASGCCLLLSAAALRDVGIFDPRYFLYYEETDLCQRLLSSDYDVGVCMQATVLHEPSHVVGFQSPRLIYYLTRNAFLFFGTHETSGHSSRLRCKLSLYRRHLLSPAVGFGLLRSSPVALARVQGVLVGHAANNWN